MNFGKLICFVMGHKRGQCIGAQGEPGRAELRTYECPRCGTHWERKVKVKVKQVVV